MKTRAWRWYLAVGVLIVIAHALLPVSFARDLLYAVIGLSAAAAILVGVRLHRPARRLPWVLLTIGVLSWAAGHLVWVLWYHVLHIEPSPSPADGLYLLGYAALAGCLFQLSRSRNRERERGLLLDSLVAGVAVALVLWVVLIEPAWTEPQGSVLGRLVGVACLVGDVLLIVLAVHMSAAGAVRSTALRLLTVAIVMTLVGDLLFEAVPLLPVLAPVADLLDVTWLAGYLLLGAAALHPSMARTASQRPAVPRFQVIGAGQLVLVTLTVLLVPLTLLFEVLVGGEPHTVPVVVAFVLIIALVYLRMRGMARRMRQQSERLLALADADVLTALANRRRFTQTIQARLDAVGKIPVPVLLVVLDRFTEINDTLGQRVGDELLVAAADRMSAVVATHGMVARVGGDTFGVLIEDESHCLGEATVCAEKLCEELGKPFQLSDVTVSIDALVGVAVGPVDGTEVEELLQRADVALSVARREPERVARYSGRMASEGGLTPHLMNELRTALDAGDIVVYYQPQVEVPTGRVVGVEALVRWEHPVHGLLPPGAFIPAAERTGLIRPITRYVLERALAQHAAWREAGREIGVSVNLSVRDLLDRGFVDDVRQALARHDVDPYQLDLEITETIAMVDPDRSVEVLRALDSLGVLLAVDDYGTGHSSLAYLQRLPVRQLKIDRSFVMRMIKDQASAVIVRSTIDLARNLGLHVVAEGVEDDATLLALRDMGCGRVQGFGLGRPVPADEVLGLVARIEARLPAVLGLGVLSLRG